MVNWRSLTPVYVPVLCSAHLMAHDKLFHIGEGEVTLRAPFAPHIHDCYEIGVIRAGTGIYALGDREYPFMPGQVYIINDLQPHMVYTSGDTDCIRLFVVHFQPSVIVGSWIAKMRSEAQLPFLPDFNGDGPLLPLDDPATAVLTDLLDQMEREAIEQGEAWEIVVGGLLVQAAGFLARRLLTQNEAAATNHERREALRRISPVLHLIESRFADPITLDEMAQSALVSRSHLCALFQTALSTSPIAYRNARRLAEGQRLLRSTDLPVQEIAFSTGFSSVQEFNRLFLREVGMQPTQFRKALHPQDRKISS